MYGSSFTTWTLNLNMLNISLQEDLIFCYGEHKSLINKSFLLSFIVSMHLFFITQSVEFHLAILHIRLWIPKMHNIRYKHFSSNSGWSDSLIKLTFCIKNLSSVFALIKFILLCLTTFILGYMCTYMHGWVRNNCII